ncbi:MAG: hypothetical protein B0W54_22075 [Cellvibrio sp. 79]|nr:MAG: hypothetical protein B0W54_22075 [Cellvibrio sp. 79]
MPTELNIGRITLSNINCFKAPQALKGEIQMRKAMSTSKKIIMIVGVVLVVGFAFLLYYEHKTACPNVAIYVKCENFLN